VSADVASPRSLSPSILLVLAGLIAVGAIAFLIGAMSSEAEVAQRAYRAFLQNFLLWAALSQGALMLSCGIRLTNGRWAGPIHRLVDSLGAFVPVSLLLYLVLWTGKTELFAWISHPEEVAGKEWWYSEGFMFWRDIFALAWMTVLSCWYLGLSIRPMLGPARETATGWRASAISLWTSGWRGEAHERDLADRRCRKLAAVLAISYGFAYSTLGVDLVMGLAPHWVSTMFPAYYAWGGFLSAVSMTALLCVVMSGSPELRGEITESRRHDLGKMVFAFSIFWMYLFWSQYLVIYYGNIPEETGFVVARLGSQFIQDTQHGAFWTRIQEPYARTTLLTWILCWVIPFWVLLGARPKKTPVILAGVALLSVIGFWLERWVLITPSLIPPEEVLAGASSAIGIVELLITAGFAGLFFLCFFLFARVFPGALPVSEKA
jgi:hypothetical protein